VHVRIDSAGHDDLAGRIDQPRPVRHWQGPSPGQRHYPPAGDAEVVTACSHRGYDPVAPDNKFQRRAHQ